jgi:hypothetical protein
MSGLKAQKLATMTALVLIISSGIVHGVWTNRWSAEDQTSAAVKALQKLPASIGNWDAADLTLTDAEIKHAELSGYVLRQYQHEHTQRSVSLLLMCGQPGPVAVHAPTACYLGAGYRMVGNPLRHSVAPEADQGQTAFDSFFVASFRRNSPVEADHTRIFWAWSTDGNWSNPDHPRVAFANAPALFKLYLIGQRHFRCTYKHEAQASEYVTPKHTCSRCVLVFSQIHAKVALSN